MYPESRNIKDLILMMMYFKTNNQIYKFKVIYFNIIYYLIN